ncbi:MAG: trimethylamine methyltransferase family protein, partial [Promethearchaeota archaeon]
GADIFGHMGICGMDQASSLDMLIMQSEVISYVESINRDINFDEDTFALDLIENVGPQGSFLKEIHTRKHFKKELWFPRLLDRSYYKSWREKGATDMEYRCRIHKNEILKNHQPEPLSNNIARELDYITEKAKKDLVS